MEFRSNDRLVLMVEVALGQRSEAELGSLKPQEEKRLGELKLVAARLQSHIERAPADWVAKAISIMGSRQRKSVFALGAPLSSLQPARSTAEPLSYSLEQEDFSLRLSYSEVPEGWQVVGRVEPASWLVVVREEAAETEPGGYFSLTVVDKDKDVIRLCRPDRTVEILPEGLGPEHGT